MGPDEFSSTLLRDFCRGEGILQSFTLLDSPQQKGIAERRIGLVMEIARTSMIHAAAPHFLWPFAVRYAAHQLNLWPRVSLPETSPTVRWTGKVGDASVFRVWGSRAFVRDTFADKLSPRAIFCDVTFDESVPFYRLFAYRSAPPLPPPLFLTPGLPPVDPLLPQGPAPSGVSQVDPLPDPAPVEVAVDSGAARGAASGGAEPGGTESEGVETGGAEPGGAEAGGGAEFGGAEPLSAALSRGCAGASSRLSPQQLREWFVRRPCLQSGASGAGGADATGAQGTGVAAGDTGGTTTTGPGGARTRGTRAARTGGVEGGGAGVLTESRTTGAGGAGAGGAGVGGPGVGGARAGGPNVGGAGAGGAGAIDLGGTLLLRPYFVPLLQQPPSPLRAPSPYTELSGGLTEHREPASCPVSPFRAACRVHHSRPPPVPGTHATTLRPSFVPLRVPLPDPPKSSLLEVPDPASDRTRTASPAVSRLLATAVTDPSFESISASPLVAELLDFAAACRLDYDTALVAESASSSPPSARGECALGTDVLEDNQEDFECLAAVVPRFASMMLAPEGDPDAPDIPTPRSYAEAITGPYVNEVPPPGANIVDGMWIFKVKRPPGSPPAFKARYVARGFSELRSYLGLQITRERARRTINLTQSHMVPQVLQRFGFQFSSPQPTPLSTSHLLSAPPSDESVEASVRRAWGSCLEDGVLLSSPVTQTPPEWTTQLRSGRHRVTPSVLAPALFLGSLPALLAATVSRFTSMLLAPEGDPDAPDIPTPRSYAEAITGPYSSQW
ncbi:unnamed protein product [Closterium sp. NIES-54]